MIEQSVLGGLDLSKFDNDQFAEINLGIAAGIDISVYTRLNTNEEPSYSADQMTQIRQGLESGIGVCTYAKLNEIGKPVYNAAQMEQIKEGLLNGVDISRYAHQWNSAEEMRTQRIHLEEQKYKIERSRCRKWVLEELGKAGIHTPMDITNYLDKYVAGQEEAKKAAAMMLWNHLHGLKTNMLFVGPSGCGKTHIWRMLKMLPGLTKLIHITDASDITQKGWKGDKKCDSILSDIYTAEFFGNPELKSFLEISVIIFDEFDKLLAPSYSAGGENVSYHIQAQFLTMIEGTDIMLENTEPENSSGHAQAVMTDTSDISFGFCGAFEDLYNAKVQEEKNKNYGFGVQNEAKEQDITVDDVIKYGARPELAGRITNITLLKPLNKAQMIEILGNTSSGPVSKYTNAYHVTIHMSDRYMDKLAQLALKSPMGVRILSSSLTKDINSVLYDTRVEQYEDLVIELDTDQNGNCAASGHITELSR